MRSSVTGATRWGRLWAAVPALVLLAATQPALAYRTSGTGPKFNTDLPVNWADAVVEYRINDQLPSGISFDDMASTVARAGAAWAAPACSGLKFSSAGSTSQEARPGDHLNTIQWVFTGWKERGFPADSAGATDVQFEKDAGGHWHIVEADVYLNASGREWEVEGPVPDGKWDVLTAVTHELGHVAGLAHPCELQPMGTAPVCDGSDAERAVTMYPLYSPDQSTLADDDVEGICFLYPASKCDTSCPSGTYCTADGCVPACGDSVCAHGEVCKDGECKPMASPQDCGSAGNSSCSSECEVDADCPDGELCGAGKCARLAALGDPCKTSEDCTQGVCDAKGTCVEGCSSDKDCGAGKCKRQAGGGNACVGSAQPFGATCDSADDCLGGQCLAGYSADPVCTRFCGEDGPASPSCPAGWKCSSVEKKSVCVPPQAPDKGCSVAPAPTSGAWGALGVGLMALCFGLRQRRWIRVGRS